MLTIIPVAAAAYAATNVDNFILLAALLARYRERSADVIAGFFVCSLILGIVGLLIGKAANVVPVQYLGLLGFVPISIGIFELIQLRRRSAATAEPQEKPVDGSKKVFMTTLSSQLGNGTDTVVVFGVLFIDSAPAADLITIITFAVMAFVFVLAGMFAVRHPTMSERIDRYAHIVMPFVLISVGAYVVANTATDLIPN